MKNILGLDLGTNSIGWALVSKDDEGKFVSNMKLGSRIIPMSQDVLGKFDSGVTQSQTAERTGYRGTRRLRERCLLRRERLLRVLHILGFLPEHFDNAIGWNKDDKKTFGKFIDESEPKIAWKKGADEKMQFVFIDAFNEMLNDFKKSNPKLIESDKKIPYDWTIYYLREKALRQPISKQELAWILLNFNQKRGYYQLRGEDEEEEQNELKKVEYHELIVEKVEATEERRGEDVWYNVYLENGWVYRRSSRIPLFDWIGKKKEFIVTTEYNEDGSVKLDKEGKERRSFRAPGADDWGLQKKRTESQIDESDLTVGCYIYRHLLSYPKDKIRGKFVRTIERKYYKQELKDILKKQEEFIPELSDKMLLEKCIYELYAKNTAHQDSLKIKNLTYLLIDDLLFYQRPLKSKKSLIADCPYEQHQYVDKSTGEVKIQHIKCVAKSNPYYQEFRLWQFIQNLRLYNNDIDGKEVTKEFLKNEEDYVRLYTYLNDVKEISQDTLLKDFFGIKKPKGKDTQYPLRWNYVSDKKYPCNETRSILLSALKKAKVSEDFLNNKDIEYRLWHLLYSVEDASEIIGALAAFAKQYSLPETIVDSLRKISFKKEYGAYSEKAIKKLLSVMRMGNMWSAEALPDTIQEVIKGSIDEKIKERMSHQDIILDDINQFKGLPVWLACYAVYGRHSESKEITKWKKPQDLANFIKDFKQHSLRNPIVEQCILETLRTVHDIWVQYGNIDEIHVELGRSMKSSTEQRKRMTDTNIKNENTNLRIKALLMELKNDPTISDVRPQSPMQQDILKLYEEGALYRLDKDDIDFKEISAISQKASPTQSELVKYKLWLEQKYHSPYTGKSISLSKLFTSAYQIEHVIPQGRYFDDSFTNKVICEAEVNQRKSNMLGFEFIKKCGGEIIHCPTIGDVRILSEDEYKSFITDHYAGNSLKAKKLLLDEIPEEFIQRQMNDSRYISNVIKGLLSNVVREEGEIDAISKNVIPCTGGITDRLKEDWGLKHVWNNIVYPRFERMNRLTNSEDFGHWENKEGKRVFQTTMPLELSKGFSKKRIDHRHHAMDALVIALASRNIVSYLNNESARDTQRREDLRQLLCDKNRIIRKPWSTFTQDAYIALQNVVVSFKNYVRVINKASNYYEHYDENVVKKPIAQSSSEQWAIRKPMHKETVFGRVNLQKKKIIPFNKAMEKISSIADKELRNAIQAMLKAGMNVKTIQKHFKEHDYMFAGKSISKVEVYYYTDEVEPMVATRKPLDDSFDDKKIRSITDTGIQKILLNYLNAKGNDPKQAFSPEGIMELNEHIADYNDGKKHQPIVRVRVAEPKGEKYNVGTTKNKGKKFVEAQSGTNLFFAIYETEDGSRSYQTIPLNQVIERLKLGWSPVPEKNESGDKLKFYLSPNDLVYVPTEDERISNSDKLDRERIYKFVDSSSTTANFIPANSATTIYHEKKEDAIKRFKTKDVVQDEFGVGSPQSKNQKAITGEMIKAVCWKLAVDRLGNITKIIR